MVRFVVNGADHDVDASARRTLLAALRNDLGLTGAKDGCGEGQCGACTVLVDGAPAYSCTVGLDTLEGARVTTVEGLAGDGGLHPVQRAFVDHRALQCGYCTPGMVMAAVALLARDAAPDAATVRQALAGNVCRCGGYPRIVQAVRAAAAGSAVATADATDEQAAGDDADSALWTFTVPALDRAEGGWGWSTPGGARLTIDDRGRVHAYVGKVDGGQGNRYSLTRVVAAELGVRTSDVELTMGDTDMSPFDLGTFGSRSTPDAGHALRVVAAAARRALAAEARPREAGDGYGALVERAGSRTFSVGADEPVAPAARTSEVDAEALRRGLAAAVTGMKTFPSDLTWPGMLHGRVLHAPTRGATLRSADATAARRMPGVTVVEDGEFVAVAAADPSIAREALRAIDPEWAPGTGPSEAELVGYLRSHPVEGTGWGGAVDHEVGDVVAARAQAHVVVEATYTTAYIAHVPLEPRVALARPDADALTVWVGTQRPFAVRDDIATALGLPVEKVRVIVPDFGGGFGGKHTGDVAVEAARLACATRRPVKVAWTREEEFRHGYFRPAAVIDVRSSADASHTITSWEFTNINSGAAALFPPYRVANQRLRFQPADSPLAQGSYRALAATANNFARESHIDELATALDIDAVELRMRHLGDARLAEVLRTAADRIGWPDQPTGAGAGIGIACGMEKDARVATATEVRVDSYGAVEVLRVVTAFDCGAVVDPDGLRLQIVGATIMGLGGALFEAVHFDSGRILNPTLSDYRVPRFTDVPPIDVIVLDRPEVASAGAGETPIIAIAPAVANAIHAATRRRLRSLPLAAAPP